jgi:hypothetical protein
MTTPTDPDLSPPVKAPRRAVPQLGPARRVCARHARVAAPGAFFALSVPVAFVHTYVAIAVWFLSLPGEALLDRYKPASFDAAFGVTARQRPPS